MTKPNLLIVVDERKMGGVSILLEDMIELGVFDEYETDVVVLHNNGQMFEKIKNKVNIIYGTSYFNTVDLPIKEALRSKQISRIFSKARLVFEMKTGLIGRRIKKERAKILSKKYDFEIAFKDGFTALFTAFGDSDKKIHWLHYEYGLNNPNRRYSKLFNNIIPKFDKFIAVSNGVKASFESEYNVSNIDVIPNIINKEKIIKMANEPSAFNLDKSKLNIVCVGRIHPVKGYERLLEVVSKLKDYKSNFKITVIGDGENIDYLKKEALDLPIEFVGGMNNPYKEIKNFDLLLLPSLYEAFGLVTLEAFILGVPVISTLTAATKDIIEDGVNGLIVENSSAGLYNGLKEIIDDQSLILKYKNNLKSYNYDIMGEIQKIKDTLREI